MSRVGKVPVSIPKGVQISVVDGVLTAKGSKGEQQVKILDNVELDVTDEAITVTPTAETKRARQAWGTTRALINNAIVGASEGFSRKLNINGVGYRAAVQGKVLKLSLGYSHDVDFEIPEGITITCPKPTSVIVEGIDQQQVGQVAANIREWRKPEPYKGKGIKYVDEYIFRKEGKKK